MAENRAEEAPPNMEPRQSTQVLINLEVRITVNTEDPIDSRIVSHWLQTIRLHCLNIGLSITRWCIAHETSKKDKEHWHLLITTVGGSKSATIDYVRSHFQSQYPKYKGNTFLQIKEVENLDKYMRYIVKEQEKSMPNVEFGGISKEELIRWKKLSYRKGKDQFMIEYEELCDKYIMREIDDHTFASEYVKLKITYNQLTIDRNHLLKLMVGLRCKRSETHREHFAAKVASDLQKLFECID